VVASRLGYASKRYSSALTKVIATTKSYDEIVGVSPGRAWFRFYAELNDHLTPGRQYNSLERSFFVPASVKDLIESFGVPHTEVELIVINGESADFSRLVRDGDRIAVYPVFESLDITRELRVRPHPLRSLKFVLDVHLGRLTAYLRMLGLDAEYHRQATDPELVRISSEQGRILLTRDRGLLKHAAVTRGYWLRQTDSRRQAAEIVKRFDMAPCLDPFTRCMVCNGRLRTVEKAKVQDRLPARIAHQKNEFRECPLCFRLYWKGSHYERMERWIDEMRQCGFSEQ